LSRLTPYTNHRHNQCTAFRRKYSYRFRNTIRNSPQMARESTVSHDILGRDFWDKLEHFDNSVLLLYLKFHLGLTNKQQYQLRFRLVLLFYVAPSVACPYKYDKKKRKTLLQRFRIILTHHRRSLVRCCRHQLVILMKNRHQILFLFN